VGYRLKTIAGIIIKSQHHEIDVLIKFNDFSQKKLPHYSSAA
jgi:hypothetical protein